MSSVEISEPPIAGNRSWKEVHAQSVKLAHAAALARLTGAHDQSRRNYHAAAEAEELGLSLLDAAKNRTIGICAVSAAALFCKSGDLARAENIVLSWSKKDLPQFAKDQLSATLRHIRSWELWHTEDAPAFHSTLFISMKARHATQLGTPLDALEREVSALRELVYRIAEYHLQVPYRTRGSPKREVLQVCDPLGFRPVVGEGRFALTIKRDTHDFPSTQGEGEAVLERLLNTLGALEHGEYFEEVVTEPAYRQKFLECAYKLAPNGEDFEELEIRPAWRKEPVVKLSIETRASIHLLKSALSRGGSARGI